MRYLRRHSPRGRPAWMATLATIVAAVVAGVLPTSASATMMQLQGFDTGSLAACEVGTGGATCAFQVHISALDNLYTAFGNGASPAANSLLADTHALVAAANGAIPAGTNAIGTLTADTHNQCSALCASLVVKASAGTLKSFEVAADATLSAADWYVYVFDATSLPVDGAVTPSKCYRQLAGTPQMGGTINTAYTTGIVIGVSTTGCYSKTASTHASIGADYQ